MADRALALKRSSSSPGSGCVAETVVCVQSHIRRAVIRVSYNSLSEISITKAVFWEQGDTMSQHTDPVCGMQVEEASAAGHSDHEGTTYYFCSTSCKDKFETSPEDYTGQ